MLRKSRRVAETGAPNMHYAVPEDVEISEEPDVAYAETGKRRRGPATRGDEPAVPELLDELVEIFERCEAYDTTQLVEETRKLHDKLLIEIDSDADSAKFNATFKHCLEKAAECSDKAPELAEFAKAYLVNLASATKNRARWKSGRAAFVREVTDLLLQGVSSKILVVRRLCAGFLSALYDFKQLLGPDRTKQIKNQLLERVYDTDVQMRVAVLEFLAGENYSKKVLDPVLFLVEHDPSLKVRLAALATLPQVSKGGIEDVDCLSVMADRMLDRHARMRELVVETIKEVDLEVLAKALTRDNERYHHKLNQLLKGLKDYTPAVAQATLRLVEKWLNETPGDLLAFLEKLKVVPTPANGEYFERTSFEKEYVVGEILARADKYDIEIDLSDVAQPGMTPEQAFLLRRYCKFAIENGHDYEGKTPSAAVLMDDITARHELLLRLMNEGDFDQNQYTSEDYILGQLLQVLGMIIETDISTNRDEVDKAVLSMLKDPVAMSRHVQQLFLIRKKCGAKDFMDSSLALFHEVKLDIELPVSPSAADDEEVDESEKYYALVVLAGGIAANSGTIHDEEQLTTLLQAAEQGFADESHKMEALKAYGWLSLTSKAHAHARLDFLVNFYQQLEREMDETRRNIEKEIEELKEKLELASDDVESYELTAEIQMLEPQLDEDAESEQLAMQHLILFMFADVMMTIKVQHVESFQLIKDGLSATGQTRAICVQLILQLLYAEVLNSEEEPQLLGTIMGLYIEHYTDQAVAYAVGGTTVLGVKDSIVFFLSVYCLKEECRRKVARVVVKELAQKFEKLAFDITDDQKRLKVRDPRPSKLQFNLNDAIATYRNIMSDFIRLLANNERDARSAFAQRRSCLAHVLLGALETVSVSALLVKNEALAWSEIKHKKIAVKPHHEFNGIMGDALKSILETMDSHGGEEISANLADRIIKLCEEVHAEKLLVKKEHLAVVRRLLDKLQNEVRVAGDDTILANGDRSVVLGGERILPKEEEDEDCHVAEVVRLPQEPQTVDLLVDEDPVEPKEEDEHDQTVFFDAVDSGDSGEPAAKRQRV